MKEEGMFERIEHIVTDTAPKPSGHYSQATTLGELLFVSGQLPIGSDGRRGTGVPFEKQANQALSNLQAILAAASSGPERVLKITAYIVGIEHWSTFNRLYAQAFGESRPARSVVSVSELHHGYLIEIDAIASRRLEGARTDQAMTSKHRPEQS
jgi:2-iminobutanoate/2-iminopropanoate deaminase